MAATEVPNSEAPAVETPEAAALSRADRQLAAMKDDNSMDRMVIRTRLAEIDRSIKEIEELIAKEKDDTKIATMNLKLADLHEARDKKHAEYKELYGELDAEADEAEAALKEISDLREDIATQEAKAKELEATKEPAKIREAAELRKEIAEKKEQLKKLTKKDREEEQKARRDAYREEEAATRKEELEQAEKGLDKAAGEATDESPTEEAADADADADEDQSTSSEDPEAKAALKKELLHNTLHKAAFGMAVVLEKDYPGEDGNAYEKTIWTGKAFLLKVLVMFGGTPKWAELLTPKQTEFLEKKVGIQFVKEDVKKDGVPTGEKRLAVKWVKPVEGWEPNIVQMADVFETAYGKDGASKAMEGIKPETTLAQLAAAAATDTSETGDKTRKLVAAMEDAGAESNTKVQEFLTNVQNAKKVQTFLEPLAATTVAGTAKEGADDRESETAEFIKLINDKNFHEETKAKEVFTAAGESLDLSKTPKELAEERLKSISTPEDLDRVVEETSKAKDYLLAMGQKDPSLPQTLVDKARTELKGDGLTDGTKAELLAVFEEGIVSHRAIWELPFKRVLEGERTLSTKEEDIKEIDVALAALKANNPAGESASAPSESIDAERRTTILAACKTHAEDYTGSRNSDASKIPTLKFDSATILPLTDSDFAETRADAEAAPILGKVKLVVKVPSTNAEEFLTFGLDASDKVIASENHL